MLKKRVKALDEVDAQFRTEYEKQSDGFFHLKVEADPEDEDDADPEPDGKKETAADRKLKEFRKENIRLRREREEIDKRYEGVDPAEYANAMKVVEAARNEEEKALMRAGKFDEVLNIRHARLKELYEKQITKERDRASTAETAAGSYRQMLHKDRVKAKVRAVADEMKLKLRSTAAEDFYARAERVFTDLDDDGELVSLDGEELRLNDDGKRFSEKDFIMDVVERAPHLLEEASGTDIRGGSKKSRGNSGVVEIDPSDPKSFGKNVEAIATGKVDVRPLST